jgi:hypothetical protein
VGKRSPILGYNHNVRYRGLVFHVQTEDSGVASPHMFTHMFHHGVIVTTRKLVYDAGSAEESIKSLMQAQHKAVLKDLRRGHFDDKIDSYLGGTPGLLPRGSDEPAPPASEAEPVMSAGTVQALASAAATDVMLPVLDELSAPVMIFENTPPPRRPAALQGALAVRAAASLAARGEPAGVDTTLKTEAPAFQPTALELEAEADLSPDIEIQLDLDDAELIDEWPRRSSRDTDMQLPGPDRAEPTLDGVIEEYTRPTLGVVHEEARRASTISDGVPGAIRGLPPAIPPPPDSRRLADRPSTINASTLPPARPISRPVSRPAVTAPQVVSRPVTSDDRSRRESEAIEVYSPALASAALPAGERPGQYARHTKPRAATEAGNPERTRSTIPVSSGPAWPGRSGAAPPAVRQTKVSAASGSVHESPRASNHTEPLRPGGMASPRGTSAATPVAAARPASGVVMTRPAVIVGAPARSSVGTMPRIRKAREDEGRGFGQGLISEKSLDEVILAYLSEDADDK